MMGWGAADLHVQERGTRYAVIGTIRRNEFDATYASTQTEAEEAAARMSDLGRRNIRIMPPDGTPPLRLRELGAARDEARRALEAATANLKAAVLQALTDGHSEVEVARQAGVDRMTIRAWAGKRRQGAH